MWPNGSVSIKASGQQSMTRWNSLKIAKNTRFIDHFWAGGHLALGEGGRRTTRRKSCSTDLDTLAIGAAVLNFSCSKGMLRDRKPSCQISRTAQKTGPDTFVFPPVKALRENAIISRCKRVPLFFLHSGPAYLPPIFIMDTLAFFSCGAMMRPYPVNK